MSQQRHQRGGATLLTVFLTGLIAFLLVFSDNTRALKENSVAQADATTEQSFYAAQSCLEDAYLQLRFDEEYISLYNQGQPLAMNGSTCTLSRTSGSNSHEGTLVAEGTARQTIRTLVSNYRDAGPVLSQNDTSIFHVLDRSGSMADDGTGCSNPSFTSQATCQSSGNIWGPLPAVYVKSAAINFLDNLNPAHDKIGLISFAGTATLDTTPALTTQYQDVKNRILSYGLGPNTNIGGALKLATQQLQGEPASRTRVVILLTDGAPTIGASPLTPEQYAKAEAINAKNNGILVITIGLGVHVNNALLTEMASTVNSQVMYFPAPNPNQLETIYDQIANILAAYNIGQGTWGEQ